jgi:hypothetical protein
MKISADESVVLGNVRFTFEYRTSTWDRGAVIRVMVIKNGQEQQALKFDPFEKDAHYHIDPDGRNEVRTIKDANPLNWSLNVISERLLDMLSEAGFGRAVVGITQDEVRTVVPKVKAVLANMMPA